MIKWNFLLGDKMKGLIIVNAYTKNEHELFQSKRMKEEFEKLGVDCDIVKNNKFLAVVEREGLSAFCKDYDFVIYYDKDKYVSKMLESCGIKLFNSNDAIRVCDDKMMTYIALAKSGIKVPYTMSAPLCYYINEPIEREMVERIENKLSYPLVVKKCYGSLGKGVYLVNDRTELLHIMEKLKGEPHLFQEYIENSKGRDIRAIVIGGKVVASMIRRNKNDFRSNIELGGEGETFVLPKEYEKVCKKVVSALKIDYAGIDIMIGKNGEPIVCEVNSNAFFGGIENITKVNVAKEYAKYIYEKIKG